MALPLAAMAVRAGAAAGRAGSAMSRGASRANKLLGRDQRFSGGRGGEKEKPSIFSGGGIMMMLLAFFVDAINIVLVFLDLAIFAGTVMAVAINIFAIAVIGTWLYMHTGKLPLKKAFLPFGLNSLPIVRFIPWWMISVWTACEHGKQESFAAAEA